MFKMKTKKIITIVKLCHACDKRGIVGLIVCLRINWRMQYLG